MPGRRAASTSAIIGFGVWRMLGGLVGMCIGDDRRWPETYRVMGLQGVELIVLGYNTPMHHPSAPEHDLLANFHNTLVMQAGAYQNGTWVVGVAQVRPRGRRPADRPEPDHRAVGRDRGHGRHAGRRGDRGALRPRPLPPVQDHGLRPSPATGRPEHYRLITERPGATRRAELLQRLRC
jgi:predicted amidohydrolase